MEIIKSTNSFREYLRGAELNEMAPNYLPTSTGLKEPIWISVENASHGPRIKVYETSDNRNFSVSIEDEPR